MKKVLGGMILAICAGSAGAGEAPFCLVNNFGQASCYYYSLDACRQAQRSMGGMCSANAAAQQAGSVRPQAQLQYPDVAGSFQRGYEQGQRIRQQREAQEGQMRLLDAQIANAEAERALSQPEALPSGAPLYRCDSQGGSTYTTTPAPGCVVVGVMP